MYGLGLVGKLIQKLSKEEKKIFFSTFWQLFPKYPERLYCNSLNGIISLYSNILKQFENELWNECESEAAWTQNIVVCWNLMSG